MHKLILILVFFSNILFAQDYLPYINGERSIFEISYSGIPVGTAELFINSVERVNSKTVFHIVGKGKTRPFFDLFFKVRDVYETFFDTTNRLPVKFVRDIYEGGFVKKQQYDFDHQNNLVYTNDTSYKIVPNSQDMLSALFYARTFKKNEIKQKKSFEISIFMDEENYKLEVKYLGNELVKTNWGLVNCMVFQPKMQKGRVFADGETMKIWITEDENHLLVQVETKIIVGTIKAFLVDYSMLKTPLLTENL